MIAWEATEQLGAMGNVACRPASRTGMPCEGARAGTWSDAELADLQLTVTHSGSIDRQAAAEAKAD